MTPGNITHRGHALLTTNLDDAVETVISTGKMGEISHWAQSSKLEADMLLQTLLRTSV